ncbi:MAG: OmpP1/FadL family transporter [Nitrospiria bacterium]
MFFRFFTTASKMAMNRYRFIALLIIIIATPNPSSAGGPVHGGKGAGMGTAFVAVADDGSAMLYNPAGLTQCQGTNSYGGLSAVNIDSRYESPAGANEETAFQLFYPGHLYLSSDFGQKNTVFGFGVFSPFGIGGREWRRQGLTRFLSTENLTGTLALNPTIAYRINPALSVGFGVNYMLTKSEASVMIDQSVMGGTDAPFDLEGDGDGWGINAGILYAVNQKVRLGFSFRSPIEVGQTGTAHLNNIAPAAQPLFGGPTFSTSIRSNMRFPAIISLGIAYNPSKRTLWAFDLEQVRWSSFKTASLDFGNEVPAAGLTDKTTPLDWRDVLQAKIGIEYKATKSLSLRGGYAWVPTPVPAHTLEPGNPDADSHNIAVGFGYTTGKFEIDSYLTVGLFEKRSANNGLMDGSYENTTVFSGFSIGYRL